MQLFVHIWDVRPRKHAHSNQQLQSKLQGPYLQGPYMAPESLGPRILEFDLNLIVDLLILKLWYSVWSLVSLLHTVSRERGGRKESSWLGARWSSKRDLRLSHFSFSSVESLIFPRLDSCTYSLLSLTTNFMLTTNYITVI